MIVTENDAQANTSEAVGQENVTPAWARAVTSFPPSDRILSTILTRQAERYGDRVLLVAGETRWTFAQTAAIAAVVVPINTALRGFQLSHIFRNSEPALLVVEAQFIVAIDSVEAGVELPP